jgi:anti-anti-sigma factor
MIDSMSQQPSERRLPAQMIIATATSCHIILMAWFAMDEYDLVLCGEDVCQIDTSGVQLLLSAARWAKQQGRCLRLVRCSDALRRALVFAGLTQRFLSKDGGRS